LTSASVNKGIEALYDGIWSHYRHLNQDSRLEQRRKKQLTREMHNRIENEFARILWDVLEKGDIEKVVDDTLQRRADPQNAAQKIVWSSLKESGILNQRIMGSAA
jgi:putative protein kinase ArgK-like GTPase of G3E family